MLESVVVATRLPDSTAAGQALGKEIAAGLHGEVPDALIVFASSRYDYGALLAALDATCRPRILVGCSSAGEFTGTLQAEGAVSALALRAPEMQFAAGFGRGLRADRGAAARDLVAGFRGLADHRYLYRTALVLTDALAGHADDLVEQITLQTGGIYQLCGGGAGDDAHFSETHVFHGTAAVTDGAVALEILSNKPIGIGVAHGWCPASPPLRVTEAAGMRVVGLNAAPAVEAFEAHAAATGQTFDRHEPLPFFLHNVLGVAGPDGYHLRVPLGVEETGAVACAAGVPAGARVEIMGTSAASSGDAAAQATRAALQQLDGHRPQVALFFDCVATRLRLGQAFEDELATVRHELGGAPFVGCNTYGQIARAEGQFGGFHNCTAVVCALPT